MKKVQWRRSWKWVSNSKWNFPPIFHFCFAFVLFLFTIVLFCFFVFLFSLLLFLFCFVLFLFLFCFVLFCFVLFCFVLFCFCFVFVLSLFCFCFCFVLFCFCFVFVLLLFLYFFAFVLLLSATCCLALLRFYFPSTGRCTRISTVDILLANSNAWNILRLGLFKIHFVLQDNKTEVLSLHIHNSRISHGRQVQQRLQVICIAV